MPRPNHHLCQACIMRGPTNFIDLKTGVMPEPAQPRIANKQLWWTTGKRNEQGLLVWESLYLCDVHLPEFEAAHKYEDDIRMRELGWPIAHSPVPRFMGSREIFR